FGDLPRLTPADLAAMLELSADVVIAPDRALLGTNALLLRGDAIASFPLRFGDRSYPAHLAEAGKLALSVQIVPKTNLIEVSMSSESAQEAADIVNAVVDAYLKNARDSTNEESENNLKRFRQLHQDKRAEVDVLRLRLKDLQDKTGANVAAEVKERTHDRSIHPKQRPVTGRAAQDRRGRGTAPASRPTRRPRRSSATTSARTSWPGCSTPSRPWPRSRVGWRRPSSSTSRSPRMSAMPTTRASAPREAKRLQKQLDQLWVDLSPSSPPGSGRRRAPDGGPDVEVRKAEPQLSTLKAQESTLSEKLAKLDVRADRGQGRDGPGLTGPTP
ncbi:MAG: hypothetical protein WKF75_12935, partial [Singulisphaera sp.]